MKVKLLKFLRRINRKRALINLRRNGSLWAIIEDYMKKTGSTGISWSDFNELYRAVRRLKPKNILELGPGASTVVMAYALMENEKEGFSGKITAMEEQQVYLQMSIDLLPEFLKKYVAFHLSPRVDYCYEIFRGVRYINVPEIDYDFIFVDGPEHTSPTDFQFCFDADLIYHLERSNINISAIVDYRLSSSYIFQTLIGSKKVRFDLVKELCYINNANRHDLKKLTLDKNTSNILRYGSLFGNTKIKMYS